MCYFSIFLFAMSYLFLRKRCLMPLKSQPTKSMETPPEVALPLDHRRAFEIAREAATHVIHRRTRLLRLAHQSFSKLSRNESTLFRVKEDLRAMIRMANAWAYRRYRGVPWRSMLYTIAALIYFVNPIDLIPDALIGLGFVDDLAVLGAVLGAIRKDLDHFVAWETAEDDAALLAEPSALPISKTPAKKKS